MKVSQSREGFVGEELQAVGFGLLVIVRLYVWNAVQVRGVGDEDDREDGFAAQKV